jgi:two-component system chemotaxis response regulator CheB
MKSKPIRVLVVDDSAFMRRALSQMLERDPEIAVVATAKDGEEAVELTRRLRPDVVTLDVEMRGVGGLAALRFITAEAKGDIAVIMVSSYTTRGAQVTLDALQIGAVDFIAKPGPDSGAREIAALGDELLEKVRACARARAPRDPQAVAPAAAGRPPPSEVECIGIGTSTGGPVALSVVLPELPSDFPAAIVIAQHMPAGFTAALAERLKAACRIDVMEGADGTAISPRVAVVAPAGANARVQRDGLTKRLVVEPAQPRTLTPSVDVLFRSLADVYGTRAMGVVLTGMGHDGVDGLRALRAAGAFTAGQDEATSTIYGMPRAAALAGVLDCVLPLPEFPRLLCRVTGLGVPLQRQEGSRPPQAGT